MEKNELSEKGNTGISLVFFLIGLWLQLTLIQNATVAYQSGA